MALRIFIRPSVNITILTTLLTLNLIAQPNLKIGTGSGIIDNSAVLELASTTKGLLLPRLTNAQMNAISTPANGLQIFNTTDGCIYIYRTTGGWISTCSPTYALAWGLTGNSGTVDGTNFIGTTDNTPLSIRVNNQRSGYIGVAATGSTFYGYQAGVGMTNGLRNTLMGYQAGQVNTNASDNVAVGYRSLYTQSFANAGTAWSTDNVAIGSNALYSNQPTSATNGYRNIAIGRDALYLNTIGARNTALGYNAGRILSDGTDNVLIGSEAGSSLAGGSGSFGNIIIGNEAMKNAPGADFNVAIGYRTLNGASYQQFNTAVGYTALSSNTTGFTNTGLGNRAMFDNTTGYENTALGSNAMESNTVGYDNVAVGHASMDRNTAASSNIAIGYFSLYAQSFNNGGIAWETDNIAIGKTALRLNQPTSNTNGYRNIGLGRDALFNNTTGSNNIALGYQAGNTLTTGSNNTLLGYNADVTSNSLTNTTAIGNGAIVDASNKIRLGNSAITEVETYGNFVTISDRRLKTNIADNPIGLNFIKALRPVHYELIAQRGIHQDGFIAQEIDSALQNLNIKHFSGLSRPKTTTLAIQNSKLETKNTEGGYYTVSYATFVVPLVNAVKELDTENTALKAKIAQMEAENKTLRESVEKNSRDIIAIKKLLSQ
jgi:trimeric autotransporter adhesin